MWKSVLSLFRVALLLLFWSPALFAQDLQINAHVSRNRVGINQQFDVTVELSGAAARQVGDPTLPNIEDFAAYLGSSSSQSVQIINGQMSVSRSITYSFQASSEGKFQIPAFLVNHKGKSYRSDPIQIEIVKSQPQQSRPGTSRQGRANESQDLGELIFLKASVDKSKVYQNEPVIVTYKIYTAVNITSYGVSQLPNTVGFWSEDFSLPDRPPLYNEVVNGRQYRVADIKKVALFPQGPGLKELDPMVVNCEVQLPRRRRQRRDIFDSFFDDPFFSSRTQRKTLRSNTVKIEVLPLPEKGKPADFSGAVGDFSISATVDKSSTKTNEAVTLKVKLSGIGNINILPNPTVDLPADFEVYDPKVSTAINRKGGQIKGSKTFEYVLIPRFPGEQVIRSIPFSYFDLKSKSYKILASEPIDISVAKGDQPLLAAPIGASKEDVRFIGQDIRFIQTRLPEFSRVGPVFYKRVPFYVVLTLPLLAFVAAYGYRKHLDKLSSNVAYARSKKANQMALKRLRQASKKMQECDSKEFFSEVSTALMGFIGDKLNVPAAGLITDDLDTILGKKGVDEKVVANYLGCLKSCDFKRFAPGDSSNGEMKDFFNTAKQAIVTMEKAL